MATTNFSNSNSLAQREGEASVRSGLEKKLGCLLPKLSIPIENGRVEVDAVNLSAGIVCEIYCRIGPLKGAQVDKVLADLLKLTVVERAHGRTLKKIIAFCDQEALSSFGQKSWGFNAAKSLGIEFMIIDIDASVRAEILAAQVRQNFFKPN